PAHPGSLSGHRRVHAMGRSGLSTWWTSTRRTRTSPPPPAALRTGQVLARVRNARRAAAGAGKTVHAVGHGTSSPGLTRTGQVILAGAAEFSSPPRCVAPAAAIRRRSRRQGLSRAARSPAAPRPGSPGRGGGRGRLRRGDRRTTRRLPSRASRGGGVAPDGGLPLLLDRPRPPVIQDARRRGNTWTNRARALPETSAGAFPAGCRGPPSLTVIN